MWDGQFFAVVINGGDLFTLVTCALGCSAEISRSDNAPVCCCGQLLGRGLCEFW